MVSYPHSTLTGIPMSLTRKQVRAIAARVRCQLVEDTWQRRMEPWALAQASEKLTVNDLPFVACWDLDHDVRNMAGERVMGATEWDPAEPDSVMVSVNGALLAETALLLSTTAHELGHVIFDAPGWIRRAASCERTGMDAPSVASLAFSSEANNGNGGDDQKWSEWRADEFMGALLTPATLLRVDFLRLAKRMRLGPSPTPSRVLRGAPAYDGHTVEQDAAFDLLATLAEQFGVSPSFIRVRLDIYDLLRTSRACLVV